LEQLAQAIETYKGLAETKPSDEMLIEQLLSETSPAANGAKKKRFIDSRGG
jgi:hypothetical protein